MFISTTNGVYTKCPLHCKWLLRWKSMLFELVLEYNFDWSCYFVVVCLKFLRTIYIIVCNMEPAQADIYIMAASYLPSQPF